MATENGSLESAAKSVLHRLQGPGGANAEEHEQALCDLGLLLGLESSRPEKSKEKKGPDVAWLCRESNDAVGLEAKSTKKKPVTYKKTQDIGQAHDSRVWLQNTYPGMNDHIWMVGDHGTVVRQANPPSDLRVVTLEAMMELAQRLISAGRRVAVRPKEVAQEAATQEAFAHYGLLWPQVAESLEYRFAIDLQEDGAAGDYA